MNSKQICILMFTLLTACNSGTDSAEKADHVWKAQTDALERARSTADAMNQEAAERVKRLEQETQ